MCGIIGYVGSKNRALQVIIEGLEHLEYRGYDSAGIAFLNNGKIDITKEQGKIINLKNKLDLNFKSNLGIGHTRWATHGEPNFINSHPHKVGNITIVHNGIIENYTELKNELMNNGYKFKSNTDTEVACALLNSIYKETKSIEQTLANFRNKARGAYAIGLIVDDDINHLYALRKDSPLIIALGKKENYIASDVPAILKFTNKYILLNDYEFAKISNDKVIVFDKNCEIVKKDIKVYEASADITDKCGYDHFMMKEINEQPEVIKSTFLSLKNKKLPNISKYNKIYIVACGSAYHAGLIGKEMIELYANIEVSVEIASEFRYKKLFLNEKCLVIVISQSGETADSLAALNIAKNFKSDTLGIINVPESSIARAAHNVIYTKAGVEVAVATTKAYSSQIAVLAYLALSVKEINIDKYINVLPTKMQSVLNQDFKKYAEKLYKHEKIFFIGRGIDYALANEGSLKLKEISYINAQGYAAGELKHGTISLIDKNTPVIALATSKEICEKTISNIKEVKARGAYVTLITTESTLIEGDYYDDLIVLPDTHKSISPLLTILPLQLISYEVAKLRKCDIDKPKNLAKSVTVE